MSAVQILNEAIQQKKIVLDSDIKFTSVGSEPVAWIASASINGLCYTTDVLKTKRIAREKLAELILSQHEVGLTRNIEKAIFKALQFKPDFRVEFINREDVVVIIERENAEPERFVCPFNSLQAEVIRHTVQNKTVA